MPPAWPPQPPAPKNSGTSLGRKVGASRIADSNWRATGDGRARDHETRILCPCPWSGAPRWNEPRAGTTSPAGPLKRREKPWPSPRPKLARRVGETAQSSAKGRPKSWAGTTGFPFDRGKMGWSAHGMGAGLLFQYILVARYWRPAGEGRKNGPSMPRENFLWSRRLRENGPCAHGQDRMEGRRRRAGTPAWAQAGGRFRRENRLKPPAGTPVDQGTRKPSHARAAGRGIQGGR